jgi:hypothetical protein
LRDRSAPVFISEFDVVLARFPRHVIDEVPIGIDALAGISLV